ncbi:MAG: LLM class flavin-dependent oxidoreductase, partial [Candidatus Hydrothermarchaeaceae archaeon]
VEGIRILRELWGEEEVNYKGRFYTLEGYRILPKPVQKPPPIWIAVSPEREKVGDSIVDKAMRRVGALADGYITMGVTSEEFHRRWQVIEASAKGAANDLTNFETSIHGMVNINNDKHVAFEESRFYFNHYYGPGYPTEDMIKIWLAHGHPEECARLIQTWIDMGITTPVLRFTSPDQCKQISLFVDKVLPLLKLSS